MRIKMWAFKVIAPALLLLISSKARSEMIAWTYSGSIHTGFVDPTGRYAVIHPGIVHFDNPATVPNWFQAFEQGIVFSGVSGTGSGSRVESAFLVGATFPTMPNFNFNTFDPRFSTFTFNLRLTDAASHVSGTLSFPGFLSGFQDVGTGFHAYYGTWPGINVVPGPNTQWPTGPTRQSITLGSNEYTATVRPFTYQQGGAATPPDYAPTTPEFVQIDAAPVGGVSATPEPSTIVLAIAGLGGAAPLLWRRHLRYADRPLKKIWYALTLNGLHQNHQPAARASDSMHLAGAAG
jgi:hypothetical protein